MKILFSTLFDKPTYTVNIFMKDRMAWMNQNQLTELFDTTFPNISMHISNILKEEELAQISVIKDYLITATDGKEYNKVKSNNLFASKGKGKVTYYIAGIGLSTEG